MEKDLIEYIAKSLVDDPDAVSVNETEGERGPVLELKVAEGDIGKVIGKYGRIAKALGRCPLGRQHPQAQILLVAARNVARNLPRTHEVIGPHGPHNRAARVLGQH